VKERICGINEEWWVEKVGTMGGMGGAETEDYIPGVGAVPISDNTQNKTPFTADFTPTTRKNKAN